MQVESSKPPYSFYTLVWKSDTPSSKPCYMQVKKSNLKSLFQTGWEIKPQIFATCGLGNSRPQILATCRLGEQKPQILAARKLGTQIPLPQAPPNLCYMEVSKTKTLILATCRLETKTLKSLLHAGWGSTPTLKLLATCYLRDVGQLVDLR